jgi:branched-chain amino acid transport system ATP-binding protein
VLEVDGLCKTFGGLRAVADATLAVTAGEIVSLIGPNGAGKTTLFAMVSGFLKPDAGTVQFQGREIKGLRPHAVCRLGVARTFQIARPFPNLSVHHNIAIGAHTRSRRRGEALAAAAEVAERLGMASRLDDQAGSLTVAGRKRLELARALATHPRLLLLDEVMAGLNATEIDEIVAVLREIRASGITILLIEHVMRAVMSLSDRAYVLNHGRMIAAGTPAAITRNADVIEAYLGHGAAARLADDQTDA